MKKIIGKNVKYVVKNEIKQITAIQVVGQLVHIITVVKVMWINLFVIVDIRMKVQMED